MCFRSGAKTSVRLKQAQGGILHQWTAAETALPRNWKICRPERSNCFAQRSGCGVEGPLPAQIGRRASGNSPMLALTNSLRQPTSRSVSAPARLTTWDNCASGSEVKWTSLPVSAGGRVYAVNGPAAQSPPCFAEAPSEAEEEAEGFRPVFLAGNLGVAAVCVDPG